MKWDDKKDELYNYIILEKMPYNKIGIIYGCSGNNIKK